MVLIVSFNTVNGKHCCNHPLFKDFFIREAGFNTVNGKHCCNKYDVYNMFLDFLSFNTVNGKHCCNMAVLQHRLNKR